MKTCITHHHACDCREALFQLGENMNFDEWYSTEGKLMTSAGCPPDVVAKAAWFVAKNEELEECAKVCENVYEGTMSGEMESYHIAARDCAEAIRMRSNAEITGSEGVRVD